MLLEIRIPVRSRAHRDGRRPGTSGYAVLKLMRLMTAAMMGMEKGLVSKIIRQHGKIGRIPPLAKRCSASEPRTIANAKPGQARDAMMRLRLGGGHISD
jgi:hypothetical protein